MMVTIRVRAENVPEGDSVYIVGNHPDLGEWDPGLVPLEKNDGGYWYGDFLIRKDSILEFKFTRGSWQSEAVDADGNPHSNHYLLVMNEGQHLIKIANWKDLLTEEDKKKQLEAAKNPESRITGTVKIHDMEGDGSISGRKIICWLPPDYDKEADVHYPVLYMHDGQNVFDPLTSYTGVDWQADETAHRLITDGKVRKLIIVGIYNTVERLEEYSDCELGAAYRRYIINTIKPFVDKNYRTLPDREHTATIGSSMGGLVSFLLGWYHWKVFGMAACLSPSFIYQKNAAIKNLRRSSAPHQPVKIYMDCGGVGGEALLYKGCRKVLRILKKRGYPEGDRLQFFRQKNANHSEWAWALRVWRPLTFLFGKSSGKRKQAA